jgi:hypothetical protein
MNLKDCIASDIDNLFFNQIEFAENVNIDGKQVDVVIDSDLLKDYSLKNGGEGLAKGELLFHAKKSDFEKKPFIDDIMRFNNVRYRIFDIQESFGVYSITLAGYQS